MDAELPQNLIPAYAWNNKKFKELYKIEVRKNLVNINSENKTNENPLLIICDKLSKSAAKAFQICYKNRNTIAKKWWTQELNISKSILSKHFNYSKEAGFPKEINNIIYNRYVLARKNFRQAVKSAQKISLHKEYNKINKLKGF